MNSLTPMLALVPALFVAEAFKAPDWIMYAILFVIMAVCLRSMGFKIGVRKLP